MSHPPNVRSFNSANGTNFFTSGERPSVRLPRRMVPSCVSDPTGCDLPLRTSSTPAMKVVLTAPMPGVRIPSFPFGGAIFAGFSMQLLDIRDLPAALAAADDAPQSKQTSNDEGCKKYLQIGGVQFLLDKAKRFVRGCAPGSGRRKRRPR